jgi:biotin carboxyl carrier protein
MTVRLPTLLKWPAVLGALAGLLVLGYWVHGQMRAGRQAAGEADSVQVPRRAANAVVKLGARLAEAHGLKDESAVTVPWQPRQVVYGRVVPNPRAATEVRAPFAGMLRELPGVAWPALGDRVKPGQPLGRLALRVAPQDRLDLLVKLGEARLKKEGSRKILDIYKEQSKRLESQPGVVPQKQRDEVMVRVAEAKIQLDTAEAAFKQWEDALAAINGNGTGKGAVWTQPLTAPGAGEITELLGRPGMAVEAGTVIARVIDFRHALVRMDLPQSALVNGPPAKLELSGAPSLPAALQGVGNRPEPERHAWAVPAKPVGPAPQVDPASQLLGYWYEVGDAGGSWFFDPVFAGPAWRPGLFVKGWLPVAGADPVPAVAVPADALLYHQGRALVYVTIGAGRYERREVRVLGRQDGRWVLAGGVEAGERVVAAGAQVLLSEEFRGEADND